MEKTKRGENFVDQYANFNVLHGITGVKSEKFNAVLTEIKEKERKKQEIIDQEEYYRMEVWKKLHGKNTI